MRRIAEITCVIKWLMFTNCGAEIKMLVKLPYFINVSANWRVDSAYLTPPMTFSISKAS